MDGGAAWAADGRRAQAAPPKAARRDRSLLVLRHNHSLLQQVALSDLRCGERFDHGPLMLALPHGATLQIDQPAVAARVEQLLGHRDSPAQRLQRSWPGVTIALALIVAGLVGFYLRGLPWLAERAAAAVPQTLEAQVGEEVLKLLDKRVFGPTMGYEGEKAAIANRFAEFAERSAPGVKVRVEFRSVKSGSGINAFALPGGTIVVLDGLVAASGSDEQVLAVLAHELGHVALRHPIRRATKGVGLGLMAGLLWGDISSVAANVPAVLGLLNYSRDEEREADALAVKVLTENGLDAQPLIGMFETLERSHGGRGSAVPGFMSSHPSTPERIERLRETLQQEPRQ
jgi:Zn-dependent protease with chaperone function